MSLFGALSASLTSLTAQSRAVNVISNNIANLSTTGFKSTSVSFATLVAGTVGGGVLDTLRSDISTQGAVNATGVTTDLAIQGNGFFVVNDASGNVRYTRAGSFRTDSEGRLVNEAGYILQGWPLDSDGRLPGEAGNVTNTTSFADLTSLRDININEISGTASPTSAINAKINLKADETILEGAGLTLTPQSTANAANSATDIIVPQSFAVGTTLTVTNDEGAAVYTYGGIETSDSFPASTTFSFAGLTDNDSFTIYSTTMGAANAVTYRFNANPNPDNNEFRNLNELADLIESTPGLRARVDGTFMYIAPDDANDALTFTNTVGNGVTSLITSLGLANTTVDSSGNRFASLGELRTIITNTTNDGLVGSITTPSSNSTLTIRNIDPTDGVTFASSDVDFMTEFNLGTTLSTNVNPVYDPATGRSMAASVVSSDFSRTITVYDSLGAALDLRLAFTKIRSSSTESVWAVELFAPPIDGNPVVEGSGVGAGGLVAFGNVSFNGDGTLKDITGSIATAINIDPAGEATTQQLTLSLGTAGDVGTGRADGLSQFAGNYRVQTLTQNGFPTGTLQSLQVDSEGFVTAIFDNSLTSRVYKLPVSFFSNPNGLEAESGNAYSETTASGDRNLGQVGEAGVGTIVPGALEVSTAEIGGELTRLIVSQQAYSASSNVLRKVGELFDELKNL
jgi:flagellar hook protein FlgE